MRRLMSGLAVLALGTVASTTVEAQACQGLNSPTNLQLSAGAGSGFKEFGAGLAFGKSAGVFAGVGGHYTKINGDGHSIGGDGTIGYQISAGKDSKLAVCPVATVGFSSGPNDDPDKVSDIDASGGLSIGIPIKSSGSKMTIIPTASLALIYDRTKVTIGGTGTGSGSHTFTDGLGQLSGGVGFVFSPMFALRPMLHLPFATPGSKVSFDLVASIGFGKK